MTSPTDAYFIAGDRRTDDSGRVWQQFTATEYTESPWGPGIQHGSPPAALITHVLEQRTTQDAATDGRLARMTTEILGAVPLGELWATTSVVRPGRRISLTEAVVTKPDGREVIRGQGWWIREQDTTEIENPDVPSSSLIAPLPEVDEGAFTSRWDSGYIDSLECRSVGDQLWLHSTIPVVAGVPDTPWTRLSAVADVANGTNPAVDPREWMFMNTDLSTYLHRLPRGEWIGVSAEANYGPDGIGLTIGRLFDLEGPVGTTNQALMLDPATPPR